MEVLSWSDLLNSNKTFFEEGSVLTVGSFDGPHKGHESLFVSVLKEAAAMGCVPGVVTFSQALPGLKHPEDYAGDIATLNQRLSEYERRGFKFALVIDFDEAFCRIEGGTFFKILMNRLNLKCIVEGVDFRCGYGGDFNMEKITAFALENGLQTVFLNLIQAEGERISSSSIRKLIKNGDFALVNVLLERDFVLEVQPGIKMKVLGDGEGKKKILIEKKNLKQVVPEAGNYSVLVDGNFAGTFFAGKEEVLLEVEESLLNKISTFNKIEQVCYTKPFVINFPKPGN